MKRFTTILTLLIIIISVLCGCGTPATKKENEIINDLVEEGYLSAFGRTCFIDCFEIIKRQTDIDALSDVIYASITAVSDDGTAQYCGDYEITYGLYNEGWLIDDVTVSNEQLFPLQGKDFSTEELKIALSGHGYDKATDISVYDYAEDLENGCLYYSLTAKDVHTYVTETIDVSLTFFFDYYLGWTPVFSSLTINESESLWNIKGEYYCSDGDNDHIIILDEEPVDFISVMYKDTLSDYASNVEGDFMYDIQYITLESLILAALTAWNDPDSEYIDDYGFSVVMDGEYDSLGAFSYVTYWNGGGNRFDCVLYIGKDKIARSDRHDVITDEYHRRVAVDTWELIPITGVAIPYDG